MKARVPKKLYNNNYDPDSISIPKKLLESKEYAKDFWNYLTQASPNKDYGETFEEWYDKLTTLAFTQKVQAADKVFSVKKDIKNVAANDTVKKGGD